MKLSTTAFRLLGTVAALVFCTGIPVTIPEAAARSKSHTFPCVAEENLEKSIVQEASVEEFVCFMKEWSGSRTLHFKISIKNVSDKPQRYRVNIFLGNGKAVGGWIPRKIKEGLVQPGQTADFVYPVGGMPSRPRAVTLKITTAGP